MLILTSIVSSIYFTWYLLDDQCLLDERINGKIFTLKQYWDKYKTSKVCCCTYIFITTSC